MFLSTAVVLGFFWLGFCPSGSCEHTLKKLLKEGFFNWKKRKILLIKVKGQTKINISYKMSVYESIRGIIAGSIFNSELKYSWMLSGQNSCQFDEENILHFSFSEAYNKIC